MSLTSLLPPSATTLYDHRPVPVPWRRLLSAVSSLAWPDFVIDLDRTTLRCDCHARTQLLRPRLHPIPRLCILGLLSINPIDSLSCRLFSPVHRLAASAEQEQGQEQERARPIIALVSPALQPRPRAATTRAPAEPQPGLLLFRTSSRIGPVRSRQDASSFNGPAKGPDCPVRRLDRYLRAPGHQGKSTNIAALHPVRSTTRDEHYP